MKKNKNKLVLIEWKDTHSGRGWADIDLIRSHSRPLYCRSVGWLVSEDGGCKVVVPHIYDEKNGEITIQGCGELTIPNGAISRMLVLREP